MTADRLSAVVLFLVAVQYVRIARTYHGLTVADVVGPSAYPILLGALTAFLAVVLFLQSKPRAAGESFWTRHGRPLLLIASLFGYIVSLEPVGFMLASSIYLTLVMVWLGERSWGRAAGLGAAMTIALWFLFDRTLHLRLPVGLFGFPP